jgi:hypothetical protein
MLYNSSDPAWNEWLEMRLRTFIDAGLVERLPSPWQLRQAELEMTPYVLSTDVTAEESYSGAALSHPWTRQAFLLAQVGPDNLRTGSGLGAKPSSVCRHLELTFHRGMPVFDLQVVQTHEGGLDALRGSIEELLSNETARARRRNRIADLLLADREAYYRSFVEPGGWIDRAARLDYPEPESSDFPVEFHSLVGLIDYAARSFSDERPSWARAPGHVLHLLGRRFREGRGMGWFDRRSSRS